MAEKRKPALLDSFFQVRRSTLTGGQAGLPGLVAASGSGGAGGAAAALFQGCKAASEFESPTCLARLISNPSPAHLVPPTLRAEPGAGAAVCVV